MKILILSFYYTPDLCAGSFRCSSLVDSLLPLLSNKDSIEIVTTLPNRYGSFAREASSFEKHDKLKIYRVKVPRHSSGMLDQSLSFLKYSRTALCLTKNKKYDLVIGTSSRLLTATLSSYVGVRCGSKIYLDIRDIFVDTIKDVLSPQVAFFFKFFFSFIESWTVSKANKVNIVSQGFSPYFLGKYPDVKLSFFPNGIDDIFLQKKWGDGFQKNTYSNKHKIRILYAGNVGEGQGLHNVIPLLANKLRDVAEFKIVGDGGKIDVLKSEIEKENCENVIFSPPVKREILLDEYHAADVLFLHLNDYDAFLKVLPSKIFEYTATGKPIFAGVSGYAKNFLTEQVDNVAVFPPGDVNEAYKRFNDLKLEYTNRDLFVGKYARKQIMARMSVDILNLTNQYGLQKPVSNRS